MRLLREQTGAAKAWIIAFALTSGVGLGALIGIGCAIGANTCPFGGSERSETTDGRVLFVANCASCHGLAGQGGTAPSLVTGSLAALEPDILRAKIARGRPLAGMPAFKRGLTPEQIAAVASYVVALRTGATPVPSLEGSPS